MKIKHIQNSAEFVSVIKSGRKLTRGRIALFFKKSPGAGAPTIGIVISKKTEPRATRRNYMRRIIYSFFRENDVTPGETLTAVVRVEGKARGTKRKVLSAEIRECIGELIDKIRRFG